MILTAEDLRDGRRCEDGCCPCTWGIDMHFPDPAYQEGFEGEEFIDLFCDPCAIYAEHLEELMELMLIGAGKKTERCGEEPDPE